MKKSISLLTAAALSLCVLGACADNGSISGSERLSEKYSRSKDTSLTYNFADGAQETPDAYNSFANQATSLELKLFDSLFSGELKNSDKIFFSPASTVLQLGLMLNGASDDAKSELLLAFGGELGVDSLNQCSSYFKSRMESVSSLDSEKSKGDPNAEAEEPKEHVSLKSSLFVDSDCNIKTSFLQSNADFYGNDIFKLDFSSRDSLVTKLGDYSESLGKLCENNYSEISGYSSFLFSETELLDSWLDGYSEADLEKSEFTNADGSRSSAEFMTSSEILLHSESAKGIMKYTKKNPLKFVAILPNEGTSLEEYISKLDEREYFKLLDSMDIIIRAEAKLPQFEIEAQDLSLKAALEQNGIRSLFDGKSKLSELSFSEDFALNELTEATPNFSLTPSGLGSGTDEVKSQKGSDNTALNQASIKFDRPFVFMIIDNESSLPVFIGAVRNL